jgi:hypothetical protein
VVSLAQLDLLAQTEAFCLAVLVLQQITAVVVAVAVITVVVVVQQQVTAVVVRRILHFLQICQVLMEP